MSSSVDFDSRNPKEVLIDTIFKSLEKKLSRTNRNTSENLMTIKPIVKGVCSKVIGRKVDLMNQFEVKKIED